VSNGGAAAAAAIAQAIKASGVIVKVNPENFQLMLQHVQDPLIVYAEGGVFRTSYEYLMSYKGIAFYTKSSDPLPLPSSAETVLAKRIWIP
jgi:hypothetical protein